jgi:hypothetical protein
MTQILFNLRPQSGGTHTQCLNFRKYATPLKAISATKQNSTRLSKNKPFQDDIQALPAICHPGRVPQSREIYLYANHLYAPRPRCQGPISLPAGVVRKGAARLPPAGSDAAGYGSA